MLQLFRKAAALPPPRSGPDTYSEAPQSLLDISNPTDFQYWSGKTLPHLSEDLEGRSGIIASMMVLRHILRSIDFPLRKDMMAKIPYPPLVAATLELDGEKSFETARASISATSTADATFAALMESRAMHKSFWRMPEFLAFMPSLTAGVTAEDTTKLARLSLVTVNVGVNDSSLKQAVESSLARHQVESGGVAHVFPHIIRVRWKYNPPAHRDFDPTSFRLERRQSEVLSVGDEVLVRSEEPTEQLYNCIAVVRLRNEKDKCDRVRLFTVSGIAAHDGGFEGPMIHGPTLVQGDEYMLYFRRSPQPPQRSIQQRFYVTQVRPTYAALNAEMAPRSGADGEHDLEDSRATLTRHDKVHERERQSLFQAPLQPVGDRALFAAERTSLIQGQSRLDEPIDEIEEMLAKYREEVEAFGTSEEYIFENEIEEEPAQEELSQEDRQEFLSPDSREYPHEDYFRDEPRRNGPHRHYRPHDGPRDGQSHASRLPNDGYREERRQGAGPYRNSRRRRRNRPQGGPYHGNNRGFAQQHGGSRGARRSAGTNPNTTRVEASRGVSGVSYRDADRWRR